MTDLTKEALLNELSSLLKGKALANGVGFVLGSGHLKDLVRDLKDFPGSLIRDMPTAEDLAHARAATRATHEDVADSRHCDPVAPRLASLRFKVDLRDSVAAFSVALAGVHEDDITVDVAAETVTVSAKFFADGDEDGSVPVIRSFRYELDIDDGEEFIAAGVKATLKRGLLSLIVPIKQEEAEVGERIKIKVG